MQLINAIGFEILVFISWLWHTIKNTLSIIHLDVLYGDPSKTYYVDDIVKPDDYSDEDEVAEEVLQIWQIFPKLLQFKYKSFIIR